MYSISHTPLRPLLGSSLLLLESPRPAPRELLKASNQSGDFRAALVPSRPFRGTRYEPWSGCAAYVCAVARRVRTPEPVKPALPAPLPGRYIVTLTDKPIATYGGDVKGLRATRPDKGERVDVNSGRAKRYRDYLSAQQANAAARVGAKPLKHYSVSLNGFSTSLTPDQARTLQRAPGVLSVTKDRPRKLTDNKNPVDFLKLSGPTVFGRRSAARRTPAVVWSWGSWIPAIGRRASPSPVRHLAPLGRRRRIRSGPTDQARTRS